MNLADRLDTVVTVTGTAGDAHAGAVVVRDGEPPVYVLGLPTWGVVNGQRVRVTGVVTALGAPGTRAAPVRHGLDSPMFGLRDVEWHTLPAG
ncbi:hypothetical protein JOF53_001386 [Crossiella equi]|uniref:Uncharacterized protein n=1 Tax=Crossiella equi TaxID=130796 RepID=A0ABS5A7D9_9PSEU|nr:hypothetical protein [Crossiella equi]MBP2472514.1 hypothetical protein [Crossiella equi]